MKILLSLTSLFSICFLQAQDINFEETVELIEKKIACCSVPFAASTKRKVDNIDIARDGNITISYSDNKLKQTFNLFELYKEDEGATGIDTIMGGKFIQFYVNAEKIRMIRFATAADAKEAYTAFLRLFTVCKREQKMLDDLNFEQTLDLINSKLSKCSEKGNTVIVRAQQNGEVVITNKLNQSFKFKFFELTGAENNMVDDNGIETIPCDTKAHAPLAWINFKTVRGNAAFIRLDCSTPKAELEIIRYAFLHLISLCTKADIFYKRPAGAMHFISRNSVITSGNELLATSIRSIDKKDDGDTTLSVTSCGEGWLDKDSLPIGKWSFYSKNNSGKQYLFKSGTYHRTKVSMFEVINIDSSDLKKNYGLSFYSLQQGHLQTIPFIKSNEWNYYHANGRLWKKENYKMLQIPISTSIVMNDPEQDESTRLIIQLKENLDEWIEGSVKEYDEKGKLYKKLKYQPSGEVYQKTVFAKSGEIIKTETARPYENLVLPTNY